MSREENQKIIEELEERVNRNGNPTLLKRILL